jgi:hypothetical protein
MSVLSLSLAAMEDTAISFWPWVSGSEEKRKFWDMWILTQRSHWPNISPVHSVDILLIRTNYDLLLLYSGKALNHSSQAFSGANFPVWYSVKFQRHVKNKSVTFLQHFAKENQVN